MKKNELLIVGKVPPPIGGVTVHVQRLLQHLQLETVDFTFIELKTSNLWKILKAIIRSEKTHIHASSTYFKVLITLWSWLFNKKLIVTLHGDLFRFSSIKSYFERLVIKFSYRPILLNLKSFEEAVKLNQNSQLIGAFLPPVEITPLPKQVNERILALKNEVAVLYCTNASRLQYDKYGEDIYSIESLVEVFNGLSNLGLIISDPSGTYNQYISNKGIKVNKNILLVSFPHDFNAVIKLSDVFIRFTTTDGDALSVKESLNLGKTVLATDVVDRPKGVILCKHDKDDLIKKIKEIKIEPEAQFYDNSLKLLLDIYKE